LGRALDLLGAEAGAVHLFETETRVLRLRAHRGVPPEMRDDLEVAPPDDPVLGRALQEEEIAPLDPASCDPSRCPGWARRGPFRSLAAFGFTAAGSARGTVLFAWCDEGAVEDG